MLAHQLDGILANKWLRWRTDLNPGRRFALALLLSDLISAVAVETSTVAATASRSEAAEPYLAGQLVHPDLEDHTVEGSASTFEGRPPGRPSA